MPRLAVAYVVHDDWYYLSDSLRSFAGRGDTFVFVSRIPWHGQPGDWHQAARIAGEAGAEVVLGEWNSDEGHRLAALAHLREREYTHVLMPDGDEVVEPRLLDTLCLLAEHELADRVYVHLDTYWKTPEYVIRPREAFTPCLLFDLRATTLRDIRVVEGGRALLLPPEYGVLHHLSYSGPEERIRRKVTSWSHRDEVQPGWWEQVWKKWDSDRLLHNLHPTHPPAYGCAERIAVPDVLQSALCRLRDFGAGTLPASTPPEVPARWPSVSVIIPLHGGREDLRTCLDWLEKYRDLLHEVIVVDNSSPDDAAEEAQQHEWVRLLQNEENEGFARACNRGLEAAGGEVVLFLNSDTAVPRAGLIRLIQSLQRSGSIAAAGSYTNYAGGVQQVAPTYTSLDTLELFAEDFGARTREDRDVDMLVGFCLAVQKRVLEEIGGFDARFGLGMFEDNDLCYRMRRAGYRLVLSGQSFVHHTGSQTLRRLPLDIQHLFEHNRFLFEEKWHEDVECGFASHLSGLSLEPIRFDPTKHPDARLRQAQERARQADISLCMIVRDEERVLADCLHSARPFFREMIVVDTGSKDRTREIAREAGAQVFDLAWPDSFAIARNESLRHAGGKWVFWMDADDTLPWETGEAILTAALTAPPEIVGFVVPVQFVDGPQGASGTRVDHVKLFRNLPGVAFEGRIHEQILASLRAQENNGIARCEGVILHSGYDTSEEGQAKKRLRDARLLKLDLKDRPDHPFVLFNLGMTDHYGGEFAGAVKWLRKCIKASQPHDSHVRKAYALLAVSLRESGKTTEAQETLDAGLALTPDDPELLFHKAHLLTGLGQYQEAHDLYLRLLQSDIVGHFSSVDMSILGYKAYHNLGNLCLQMDNYPEARQWYTRAMEAAPHFLPSAFELFDAALKWQDFQTAQKALQAVQAVDGGGENWASMGARYAEAVGGPDNAFSWLVQAVQQNPQRVGPRLLLVRRLLKAGYEREAVEHLLALDAQNVAEAAFYLGIAAGRAGQAEQALAWMERALELSPTHEPTREQITVLRQALGREGGGFPPLAGAPRPVSLDQALAQMAAALGLNVDALRAYAQEDGIGGYGLGSGEGTIPRWRIGSVWEAEGKALYALVRALKPETIVEVGSLVGCSTSHLALACQRNGRGTVYAVDPNADFARVDPNLLPYIQVVQEDVFTWTPPRNVDFVFEDGAHTPGFTGRVLQHLRPSLAPQAAVLCHDACHPQVGTYVWTEFAQEMGAGAGRVLIAPSDCGLGFARYAGTGGAKPASRRSHASSSQQRRKR